MLSAVLLSLLAVAFAADPSDKTQFHDTGNLLWRDCGASDAWLTLSKFDASPSPLRIPTNASLTLHGQNGDHPFDQNIVLWVNVQKRTLNRWTKIPCGHDLGSCLYDDPCKFMTTLFSDGCPAEFVKDGLPCTCPFSIPAHKALNLNNDPITLSLAADSPYKWLTTGEFYIKMVMYEKGQPEERMCLEFYVDIQK